MANSAFHISLLQPRPCCFHRDLLLLGSRSEKTSLDLGRHLSFCFFSCCLDSNISWPKAFPWGLLLAFPSQESLLTFSEYLSIMHLLSFLSPCLGWVYTVLSKIFSHLIIIEILLNRNIFYTWGKQFPFRLGWLALFCLPELIIANRILSDSDKAGNGLLGQLPI